MLKPLNQTLDTSNNNIEEESHDHECDCFDCEQKAFDEAFDLTELQIKEDSLFDNL